MLSERKQNELYLVFYIFVCRGPSSDGDLFKLGFLVPFALMFLLKLQIRGILLVVVSLNI